MSNVILINIVLPNITFATVLYFIKKDTRTGLNDLARGGDGKCTKRNKSGICLIYSRRCLSSQLG